MLSGLGCAHGRSRCFLWRCTDISIFTQLVSATPFSVEEILLLAASARPNLCWKRTLSRGEISISQLAASCRPSPSSPGGKAPAQRLLFPSAEQLSSYDALFKPRSPAASLTDRCGADCSLARHSLAQRCRGITPQLWQRLCRTRPGEERTAAGLKPHWDIGNSCLAVGRGWERGVMVPRSRWLPAAGDGLSIAGLWEWGSTACPCSAHGAGKRCLWLLSCQCNPSRGRWHCRGLLQEVSHGDKPPDSPSSVASG